MKTYLISHINEKKQSSIGLYIFLSLFAMFLFWIFYHTPMRVDDFLYPCVIENTPNGITYFSGKHIENFKEFITSAYYHRYLLNGRIANTAYQFLMYLGIKKGIWAAILSTCAVLAHIIIYSKLCFKAINLTSCAVVTAASILLLPNLEGTILWYDASLNYLWGGIWLGLFLILHPKIEKATYANVIGATIIAFICGCWHEQLGVCLCFALFVIHGYEYLKTKKLGKSYILVFICLLIGSAIPVSAPAIWKRVGNSIEPEIAYTQTVIRTCFHFITMCFIPITLFFSLLLKNKPQINKNISFWFIIPGIFTIVFLGSSGKWGGVFYFPCLCILIYSLLQLREYICSHKRLFNSLSIVFICFVTFSGILHMKQLYDVFSPLEKNPPNEPISLNVIDIKNWAWYTGFTYYASTYYNRKIAPIIYNSRIKDKTVYNIFRDKNPNEFHFTKTPIGDIIQCPSHISIKNLAACRSDYNSQEAALIYTDLKKYDYLRKLFYKFVQKKEIIEYSIDYHHNMYYIVMERFPTVCKNIDLELHKKDKNSRNIITIRIPDDL